MDQVLTKKLKADGHAVPIQCDSPNSNAGGPAHDASERLESDVNALTDGSDGSSGGDTSQRNYGADGTQASGTTVAPVNFAGYVGTTCGKTAGGATSVAYDGAGFPFAGRVLDERQLKRERRKQANRESARKSRMRKQAEYEELVQRCETLDMENMALKSELDQLNDNSEKLRLENAALMEKLELSQVAKQGGSNNIEADQPLGNCTENLPNASDHGNGNTKEHVDCNNREHSNSESKLHNLLEPSSRTDTIAAR